MLMAAGLGTRLKPFTTYCPKALIPVMGVPVAQFALDALAEAGVREVVVNIHHQADLARAGFERAYLHGMKLIISDESKQLLGSAGGIRKAFKHFQGEAFFLLNADVMSDLNLRELGVQHSRMKNQWDSLITLAVSPSPQDSPETYREIVFDENNSLITKLGEKKPAARFFTGAAVIESEAIVHLKDETPSELVPEVLIPAIEKSRACVFYTRGIWMDIGSPGLWLKAHLNLLEGLETGAIPRMWRESIQRESVRLADRVWAKRSAVPFSKSRVNWVGPSYFAGTETTRVFGPEAVIYGRLPKLTPYKGIGYAGEFLEFV